MVQGHWEQKCKKIVFAHTVVKVDPFTVNQDESNQLDSIDR